MYRIILLFILVHVADIAYGQCNCEKINRDDGTIINQCSALPVAYDNSTQVGINAASNGENIFITLTIRFQTTAKNIVGNLSLRLVDNNLLNFSYVNSGLSFIGNSEVAQGIFLIKETDIAKLKTSRIMTISFKLNDGLLRTYQVNTNADVLKSQVSCL